MALRITSNSTAPVFSDIDPKFTRNPKNNDLLLLRDDSAIRTSLRNLMATAFGERLFQPVIGGSLRPLLFEPIDAITTMEIRDRILYTINRHEPRIGGVFVDVIADADQNQYTVNVEYSVLAIGKTDKITVVLERVR
jgi:phage baseplate assembly protein W